jgi:hypothetical protein
MVGNVAMDRTINTMDKLPGEDGWKNGSRKPFYNTMMNILRKVIDG